MRSKANNLVPHLLLKAFDKVTPKATPVIAIPTIGLESLFFSELLDILLAIL